MASTSAISGLVSGLDTKTIISQLMSIARAPQDDLKTSLAKTNTQITAAQSINSKAASMTTLAKELAAAKTYTTSNATSSNATVSATASATAATGSVSFVVVQTAAAHQATTGYVSTSGTSPLTFSISPPDGGAAIELTAATGSATDVAAAINGYTGSQALNVTAQVVKDQGGEKLLLSSSITGADKYIQTSGITSGSTGSSDALTDVQDARDAKIKLASADGDASGSAALVSSTNTFKDLIPGVDVTVSAKTEKSVTVSNTVNQSAITSKVSNLVAAMNNVLTDVAFHTKALPVGTTASSTNGGLLRGNSTMRDLAGQVVSSVSAGTAGGDNATLAGLSVTRQGQVTFDSAAFDKLYKSDPTKAADVLAKFASAVQSAGSLASDSTSGSVTSFITGSQTTVRTLTDNIATWDTRLASKQKRLEAQYGALEVALQKLSGQGNALEAALKQLNGNN